MHRSIASIACQRDRRCSRSLTRTVALHSLRGMHGAVACADCPCVWAFRCRSNVLRYLWYLPDGFGLEFATVGSFPGWWRAPVYLLGGHVASVQHRPASHTHRQHVTSFLTLFMVYVGTLSDRWRAHSVQRLMRPNLDLSIAVYCSSQRSLAKASG